MVFVVVIGALGTLLILFAHRISDDKPSRLRRFLSRPFEILGVFLLSIAAIVIGATFILPWIMAALTTLF